MLLLPLFGLWVRYEGTLSNVLNLQELGCLEMFGNFAHPQRSSEAHLQLWESGSTGLDNLGQMTSSFLYVCVPLQNKGEGLDWLVFKRRLGVPSRYLQH